MMDREIIEAIQKITGTQLNDPVGLVPCTVNSVDLAARTCDCTAIGGETANDIPDVELMAEVDDGFLLVPAVGSTVIVTYSKANVPFVSLFSAIDQVVIITGNSQVIIQNGLIQLNDGSYGGLVQVINLVQKLNNLENLVNDLVAKFNMHVHPGVQSGAGSTGPTVSLETGTLTPTEQADIENTEVTHGKLLQ